MMAKLWMVPSMLLLLPLLCASESFLMKRKQAPWTVTPSDFSDSMTMTALVVLDGAPQTVGTLGAFVDGTDEVRGVQNTPMMVPFGKHQGKHLYSIMIYGNGGSDAISFKFMKGDGTEVGLKEKYVFQINANKGSPPNPDVLTNDVPPAADELPAPQAPAPAPGWEIDHAQFENSMTVTFDVAIDGDLKSTGELAAFAGEEIRGLSTPNNGLLIPPFGPFQGKPVYQLMIYADQGGEPITFKYKTADGTVYPLQHKQSGTKAINFRVNGNMGNVQRPLDAVNY